MCRLNFLKFTNSGFPVTCRAPHSAIVVGARGSASPEDIRYRFHQHCTAFLYLQSGYVVFWQKNIVAKAACKMLVKVTTGVDFTNILCKAFMLKDSEKAKNNDSL